MKVRNLQTFHSKINRSLPLYRVAKTVFALLLLTTAFACKDSTPPPAIPAFCGGEDNSGQSSLNLIQEELNYKDDILPILQQTDTGKIYRCLVCHSGTYQKDDIDEKTASELIRVIEDGSMPSKNDEGQTDKVSPEEIGVIKKWFALKFKPVEEVQPTETEGTQTDEKISGSGQTTPPDQNKNSSDLKQGGKKC